MYVLDIFFWLLCIFDLAVVDYVLLLAVVACVLIIYQCGVLPAGVLSFPVEPKQIMKHCSCVVLMLGLRLRRWPSIKTAHGLAGSGRTGTQPRPVLPDPARDWRLRWSSRQ